MRLGGPAVSSRRTSILIGALLLLLAAYFAIQWLPMGMPQLLGPGVERPLAGKDSISALKVKQAASGVWTADFDYFYTGAPISAQLLVELTPAASAEISYLDTYVSLQRGSHHVSIDIRYPGMQQRTVRVTALIRALMQGRPGIVASQQLDQVIDWPEPGTWVLAQSTATRSPEDNLKQAQALIDTDSNLAWAKAILEKLLEQNPDYSPAYVELARIARRTNQGPEGLHQAEDLLATALQVQPDNTDAKILLGDIYVYQRRFVKAEVLFKEAAATRPSDPWLWTHWGEMLEMEHHDDQAIVMYRKVIAHPMTHDRNDRARSYAYEQLLALLSGRKKYDDMEALYKQRIAEFGPGSCYSADYTRFLLQIRGNVDAAIDSARRALNQSCNDSTSRALLGAAEYAKWADSKGLPRTEALNQARIYLPISASALYGLARFQRTTPALRQLIASGEPIDQKDGDDFDALAYALRYRDRDAIRRLVALGARTTTPVGELAVPAAFLPVLSGDAAGVRQMRKLGVDYSKLKFRGVTALDLARQQGNEALLSALGNGGAAL